MKLLLHPPQEINKTYVKTLQSENPGTKLRHFSEIYNLTPLQIINIDDKTIITKEIQGSKTDQYTVTYFRNGAIISIYSNDLKLIKDIPIDKASSNFAMGFSQIDVHVKGDQLYAITNERRGIGYKCVLYKVNLSDYSMTQKEIQDPENGPSWITTPGNVIWYDTNFMIPFVRSKSIFKLNINTKWAVENY